MQLRLRIQRNFRPVDGDVRLFWPLRFFELSMGLAGETIWTLELYYKRVLFCAGLALAGGYVCGSVGLYWWLSRNPHNQVGLGDVFAVVWSRQEFRRKLGDSAIRTAVEQLREKNYVGAYHNLRVGLSRSPGNHSGRLLLARWIAAGDARQGTVLLEKGLPYSAAESDFLAGLFSFYGQLQIRDKALRLTEDLVAGRYGPLPEPTLRLVHQNRAALLVRLGRTDDGLAELALAQPPAGDAAAQLLHHRLEVDLRVQGGRAAEARERFERTLRGPHLELDDWRREAEIAIALGDAEGLQSALRHMRAAAPDNPSIYAFAFSAWKRVNRLTFRDAAEQEYYRLFGSNDTAMQAFAAAAVNLDEPQVVARARQVAVANRLSGFAYGVHLTEIALRRGDFEEATRLLRDWEQQVEELTGAQRFYPGFVRRLARASFAASEEQNEALVAHLGANRAQARLPIILSAVRTLEKAGNTSALQKVMQLAQQWFPDTDEVQEAQARLNRVLEAAAAGKAAEAVPATVALPATAADALARLDQHLATDQLGQARDLIRAIRAAKPGWLPAADVGLARREIELSLLALDAGVSRSLVRGYLDRHTGEDEAMVLVELARRLAAAGRTNDARLLHDELVGARSRSVRVLIELRTLNLRDDLEMTAVDRDASLAALDRDIEARKWAEADRLMTYLRKQAPQWAVSADVELKVREIRIRLGLFQRPTALSLFKEIVIKPGMARSAAFRLVRDYVAQEDRETALMLAREVFRLMPGDAAAEKLLREAQAPGAAPPED